MATSREARTALPPSLAANPRLGDWLRVLPGGAVEVRSGKVELGQGVLTALAQVAAAEARAIYLGVAAGRWNGPADVLAVRDGTITAPDGRTTSYWELADDGLLDRPAAGRAEPKAASDYRIVGTSVS